MTGSAPTADRQLTGYGPAADQEGSDAMIAEPNVLLDGGKGIPETERIRFLECSNTKFKLFRGNRYEHFEPTGRTVLHGGRELSLFVWSATTYVAE